MYITCDPHSRAAYRVIYFYDSYLCNFSFYWLKLLSFLVFLLLKSRENVPFLAIIF